MTTSSEPVSSEGHTVQFSPSTPTDQSTISIDDYLESKNLDLVSSLTPTLSYVAFIMVCGLVGNTVAFLVYYKKFKPSVTRTYILAMSVCDLLTNVLSLPMDVVEIRFLNSFESRWACKSFRTVKSFLGFLSAYILVAVAFDRQRAICSPRSNPTTIKRARITLVVVSLSALAFTLPYSELTGGKTLHYEGTNITGQECSIDDMYAKSLFLFLYNITTGLVFIVCIVLMVISYVRIARQLWLHKKNTATIMSLAAGSGNDKRKTSTASPSHTTSNEESSSHRTQSVKSKDGQTRTGTELAHFGPQHTVDRQDDASVRTQTNLAENPNGTCFSANIGTEHDISPQTVNTNTTACEDNFRNVERKDIREEATSSTIMTSDTSTSITDHNADPMTSDPQQSGRRLSRSRAVLSRIRRTASDARSFITRKKYTSSSRGSVKKIPTRTTFMMFVLTVVFTVNYLPYLAVVSYRSRHGDGSIMEKVGLNGYHINLRSYFINSAVNPLVYSFCSARFRKECRSLCNCKR